MFNLYIERYETALTQFSYITYRSTCRATKIISLFRIAVCKKRLGEYKLAQTILKMIIGTPEGYKNYLVIKLEIIHVKLLEGNIIEAGSDLEKFINFKEHSGVTRLYIYILYKLNRYDDLFKYANMVHKDIYVDYIVLRTKFELNSVDENFEIAFEDLIKESKRNFAVITTYANYKVFNGKYNEALQYYDLAIDNNYTYYSAIKNKETLTKLLEQKDKFSEREFWNKIVDNIVDGDPEVESIGYFKLFLQDSCVDFLFNKKVFDTIPIVEVSLKEFD
ncbi:hypothetical protein A0H76_2754 [Hepatospora eriocheir]|uniref:Uncharacterized protein n=1 Tax=Hepatospora eriocheir TaxID=1081669 RepID=A0A1X0QJF1_9MICR|nr:hypothetical protein A0H76_2754 [Hepatospora eriocheir]